MDFLTQLPSLGDILFNPISYLFYMMYGGLMLWEAMAPAKTLPHVEYWRLKGMAAFLIFFLLASYLPLIWDNHLAKYQIMDLTALGTIWGALVGVFLYELGEYIWHRTMHSSNFLWKVSHQMHHSAERLDTFGAFYFSPIDMIGWTALGSFCLVFIAGFTPEASIVIILTTNFLSIFQHANVNTPSWLGYLIQRPEAHNVHHGREIHAFNYSGLPIYDVLFGTFKNPDSFENETGFYNGSSNRIVEMILFRDISLFKSENKIAPDRKRISSKRAAIIIVLSVSLALISCEKDHISPISDPDEEPTMSDSIYYLPVVVHVIHNGEAIGTGVNFSEERIKRQIAILNEDFRKKEGTRGYNNHPDGADTKMEFVLAKRTPDQKEFDGINRVDISILDVPELGYNMNHYAQYAYWNSSEYINIWVTPLPQEATCIVLGQSSGPDTDLPGTELLMLPGPSDAEGILINADHFGESDINCHAKFGRTLTHEMGHYFGLLHPWGAKDCSANDYCEDTPAVDREVFGSQAFTGCNGEAIMIGNYMNFADDEVMNIFSKDQVARMHYVLSEHLGRKALLSSQALHE